MTPSEKGAVMDKDEITNTVREAIAEGLGVDPDKATLDATFQEDLDADSLDVVEVALVLEEKLGIQISDDEMRQVRTVRDAVDLAGAKLGVSV